ncbi:NmrA family NAD(P)-binding protein [Actinoplanes sp. CA-015351]|uniref:NmrA family NAD(P)-binding protein n=1 Tax=Actinoplanes sp. CA-015351 TaxID=3239897 RepID=UPI003D9695B5
MTETYAITGVTGHVGGATARALITAGRQVRAISRRPGTAVTKGRNWTESAQADLADTAALTRALYGCAGAFLLLPTVPPFTAEAHRDLITSMAAAVEASGVPHVVMLSSWGADLAEGTGPIRWLHDLENRLRATGARLTAIRSPHFQEKVETVLDAAIGAGVYPVFADETDKPIPMVATRDIGEAVAQALTTKEDKSEVVVLDAPTYTESQVAEALATALGKPLTTITIPREAWHDTLTTGGIPSQLATELVALYAADADGRLQPRGDRTITCTTPIEETLEVVTRG